MSIRKPYQCSQWSCPRPRRCVVSGYVRFIQTLRSTFALWKGSCPPLLALCHTSKEYGGPHKLLPAILSQMGSPSACLRHLFIENVHEAGDPLDAFINSLESCHPLQLRVLTHLFISLPKSMDLKSLAKLQDMFPVLEEFFLHASNALRPSGLSCEFSEIPCPFYRTLPPPFTCIHFRCRALSHPYQSSGPQVWVLGPCPTSLRPRTVSFLDCRVYTACGYTICPSWPSYGVEQAHDPKSAVPSMKVSDARPVSYCAKMWYLVRLQADAWHLPGLQAQVDDVWKM
jgi:hypothetical protein